MELNRSIFSSDSVFEQELKTIFAECWQFLGHESQIPDPGNYFVSYIGIDPIIVIRAYDEKIYAYLNSCSHRGGRLVNTYEGSLFPIEESKFVCPYHGRVFNQQGDGLPQAEIEVCNGFIFGTWSSFGVDLKTYFGDFLYYFDAMCDGLQLKIKGPIQRYRVRANWKIIADNFTGDAQHLGVTHLAMWDTLLRPLNPVSIHQADNLYSWYEDTYGHGMTSLEIDGHRLDHDLNTDYIGYVESIKRKQPHCLGFGNIFPTLAFNDFSLLRPIGLYRSYPISATETEIWNYCLIDDNAPEKLKEEMYSDFGHGQSITGLASHTDAQNFTEVTRSSTGWMAEQTPYELDEATDTWLEEDYPGIFCEFKSENPQRNFYECYFEHDTTSRKISRRQ